MIKLCYFIHRLPSLSPEAFHSHWRNQHAALIVQHATVFGIRRYVQLHATEHPGNRRHDGVCPSFRACCPQRFQKRQSTRSITAGFGGLLQFGAATRDSPRTGTCRSSDPNAVPNEAQSSPLGRRPHKYLGLLMIGLSAQADPFGCDNVGAQKTQPLFSAG